MKIKAIAGFFSLMGLALVFGAWVAKADVAPPPPPATATDFSFNLKKGWNMMSVPISILKDGSSNITQRDLQNGGCAIKALWKYNSNAGKYIQPSALKPMEGYWALVDSDCSVSISGTRNPEKNHLGAGWNMISSKYSWKDINTIIPSTNPIPPIPGSPAVVPDNQRCQLLSKIYTYDPIAQKYTEVAISTKLDDTKGYWVKIQGACVMPEPKTPTSLSQCLPADIKLSDVVDAKLISYNNNTGVKDVQKTTVEQVLNELEATCNSANKLVDAREKQIRFFQLIGCWGNPPYDYRGILQKQQDEIDKLKEQYTVIEMTCDPSGEPAM